MSNLEHFLQKNNIYHFEGQSGIENLNKITEEIGYKANSLRWGSSLEVFLQDNPGAMQAVVDWIGENHDSEFEEEEEEICEDCGEYMFECECD